MHRGHRGHHMFHRYLEWARQWRRKLRKRLRDWATDDLQTGDLTALGAIASRRTQPKDDTLRRLFDRRFVSVRGGKINLTLRGQVALMIRRSMF
jgi:hypothetical protein